jgi:CheY-like chemotaxis protein
MLDPARPERRRRPLVVTVDDQPDQRKLISIMLSKRCEVLQAATSEEALEIVARHERGDRQRVKYVLTDSNLPNFDGLQLCRHLRAHYGNAHAIVFVTASGDHPETCKRIELAGANAIVTKPFAQIDLFTALRETRTFPAVTTRITRIMLGIQAGLNKK